MSYLKVNNQQESIRTTGSYLSFLNSISSNSTSPDFFKVTTDGSNKANVDEYLLSIQEIKKEDGSGKSFMFKATGYAVKNDNRIPIAGNIEGYIRF